MGKWSRIALTPLQGLLIGFIPPLQKYTTTGGHLHPHPWHAVLHHLEREDIVKGAAAVIIHRVTAEGPIQTMLLAPDISILTYLRNVPTR
jgi:hypothetical protein